jgi:hypothetical protein
MSAPKRQGYDPTKPAEEKSLFDENDDLSRPVSLSSSLSYHDQPRTPLNGNSIRGGLANVQASAHEGLPPQARPQNQTHPAGRNQSWDLLGGARKLGQAYERFDPHNTREQHLAFADGDLPNSKASAGFCVTFGIGDNVARPYQFVRFYQYLINTSIVTRWTLFIVPILIFIWIPGILSFTASPRGQVDPTFEHFQILGNSFSFLARYGGCA